MASSSLLHLLLIAVMSVSEYIYHRIRVMLNYFCPSWLHFKKANLQLKM